MRRKVISVCAAGCVHHQCGKPAPWSHSADQSDVHHRAGCESRHHRLLPARQCGSMAAKLSTKPKNPGTTGTLCCQHLIYFTQWIALHGSESHNSLKTVKSANWYFQAKWLKHVCVADDCWKGLCKRASARGVRAGSVIDSYTLFDLLCIAIYFYFYCLLESFLCACLLRCLMRSLIWSALIKSISRWVFYFVGM